MILSGRNDQFRFEFPRNFIPKSIVNKYKPYINKMPGVMIEEPIDFFNYGIQSMNLPGPGFDPVSQNDNPGNTRKFRSSLPKQELFDKTMTLTFQAFNGWINYWMAIEIFDFYYDFQTKQQYLPEGVGIQMLDGEGFAFITVQMKDMLMTKVNDIDLNFSSNTVEFKTFTIDFTYNALNIAINID